MTWLTEDPLIPLLTGAFLTVAFLAFAMASRERSMWLLSAVCLIGTISIGVIETVIVTEREEATEMVYQLAFRVQQNDVDGVVRACHPDFPENANRVKAEMPRYDFSTCRMTGVTEFEKLSQDPGRCKIVFNVAFRVAVGGAPEKLAGQRRVRLTLQRDGRNDWKITDYEHWNPRQGIGL